MLPVVFSQLVKDYRIKVRHCRELERSTKAEKYKMTEYVAVYLDILVCIYCKVMIYIDQQSLSFRQNLGSHPKHAFDSMYCWQHS